MFGLFKLLFSKKRSKDDNVKSSTLLSKLIKRIRKEKYENKILSPVQLYELPKIDCSNFSECPELKNMIKIESVSENEISEYKRHSIYSIYSKNESEGDEDEFSDFFVQMSPNLRCECIECMEVEKLDIIEIYF